MAGRAVAPPAEAPALRWEFLDLTTRTAALSLSVSSAHTFRPGAPTRSRRHPVGSQAR
jgi:hypothetical protein